MKTARQAAAAALILATLSPATGAAGDAPVFLLPLTAAGSTDGKGVFKLGAGVSFGASEHLDISLTANGSVSTDGGLTTAFDESLNGGKSASTTTWDVGGSVSFAVLGDRKAAPIGKAKFSAFSVCNARCETSPDDAFCKNRGAVFKKKAKVAAWIDASYATLPVGSFCVDQRKAVRDADAGDPLYAADADRVRKRARKNALKACVATCAEDASDPFCQSPLIQAELLTSYQEYDNSQFCDEGKKQLEAHFDKTGRNLYPPFMLNVGGKYGFQSLDFRKLSADQPNLLIADTQKVHPWSAGAAAIWSPSRGRYNPTFELQALGGQQWTPSSTKVKWCSLAGNVPRQEPKPGMPVGPTDEGQVCQEATYGAPAKAETLTLLFRGGIADGARSTWRAAIGPDVKLAFTDKGVRLAEAALRVPIYISFKPFEKADYRGILRLTPALTSVRNDDGPSDLRVSFELALLGQRYLFSDRFDQL